MWIYKAAIVSVQFVVGGCAKLHTPVYSYSCGLKQVHLVDSPTPSRAPRDQCGDWGVACDARGDRAQRWGPRVATSSSRR
jgi:invasion protein IalB